jgi:hypothetical protein
VAQAFRGMASRWQSQAGVRQAVSLAALYCWGRMYHADNQVGPWLGGGWRQRGLAEATQVSMSVATVPHGRGQREHKPPQWAVLAARAVSP